jgi:nicotinamide-nucleotide amidase
MICSIISIGTELSLGLIVNDNSRYIAEKVTDMGIECRYMLTTGDSIGEIVNVIRYGLKYSDVIIVNGGLGPTDDDITRKAVARALKLRLVRDKSLDGASFKFLREKRNKSITERLLRQSYIPKGAYPIKPVLGSASGFRITLSSGKILFCIPGVPKEMRSMFEEDVMPFLKEKMEEISLKGSGLKIRRSVLLATDISETETEEKIKDVASDARKNDVRMGITVNPGLVKIILLAKAKDIKEADRNLRKIEENISKKLGSCFYGKDNSLISDNLKEAIKRTGSNLTLSTAESITGGLASSTVTDTPGSSEFFLGGVVSYSEFSKTRLLGVDKEILNRYGAVSREVCLEMAKKAKEIFKSDYSLSVTGFAGPEKENEKAGLVYCCILGPDHYEKVYEKIFHGSRCEVKFRVVQFILNELRVTINEKYLKKRTDGDR